MGVYLPTVALLPTLPQHPKGAFCYAFFKSVIQQNEKNENEIDINSILKNKNNKQNIKTEIKDNIKQLIIN